MNREQMKQLLQRDKQFLKELYESESVSKSKRIINFASDGELNTLCKYLHFLSNGDIKIKKHNFEAVSKKQMFLIRKSFESKKVTQNFFQTERKRKIQILLKLISAFSHLLAPLFNQ